MERRLGCLRGVMGGIGLLILIFDSRLAAEGASEGIELCIRSVIPALFPFFVLSMVLTNSLNENVSGLILFLANRLRIPDKAVFLLIPSVLGGYPVGAKCIGDLFQKKIMSKNEAEWLLGFCNNAGPSFLFGILAGFFPERKMVWLLWLIQLLSAVLTAIVLPVPNREKEMSPIKGKTENTIIHSAAKAMILVCCWVILFRVIITFLEEWFFWLFPAWVKVFVMGILELTNGCFALSMIREIELRFILCSCMLTFGGICVLFQTVSVTHGLSIWRYLKGKMIQTVFSLLLSCIVVLDQGVYITILIPIIVVILRKTENRCRNPKVFPV